MRGRLPASLSTLALAALSLALPACTRKSSHSTAGALQTLTPLVLVGHSPGGGAQVFLNQPILVRFNLEVDLSSVNLNSFQFHPFDRESGKGLQESVEGEFSYLEKEGRIDKRVILFQPRLPLKGSLEDAGFRPGRRYLVHLNGSDKGEAPLVRSLSGKVLAKGFSFSILTPPGKTPNILFKDSLPWGPRKVSLSPEGTVEKLNFFTGGNFKQILLTFDQPLNPSPSNLGGGRIRLEYKDPLLSPKGFVSIPSRVTLVQNLPSKSIVSLLPEGVLPSNAQIRVIADKSLEDLSGQSNASDPTYHPLFGTFKTEKAANLQYDALQVNFSSPGLFDPGAPQREPLADWSGGSLKAAPPFPAKPSTVDFHPSAPLVYLNTDYEVIYPPSGPPMVVKGGVFHFRDILIPKGVEVRGTGSNPLVLVASGKVLVEGKISVDGKDAPWDSSPSIPPSSPSPGGSPACGGGRGGDGSPERAKSSLKGQDGFGPGGTPGGGGKGGHSAYEGSEPYIYGAAGGGGSLGTRGDPLYLSPTFPQMEGRGGDGNGKDAVTAGSPPKGGAPGNLVWKDKDEGNNFYGRDVRLRGGREELVIGELQSPVGGAGGGGGGDKIPSKKLPNPNFLLDKRGGGGGAGGGVLVIQAAGPIRVTPTGSLTANGGNGAGGDAVASCNQAGGGGGGSGGMIVLVSGQRILVEPKYSSFIQEGDFPVSADGGIGTTGTYGGGGGFSRKYPARNMGRPNRGGFGGLGIVEFLAPDPARDITFPKGQVKPAPILLPSPYGILSRARTRWIYTGATARQSKDPGSPRYLDPSTAGGKRGPEYRFPGIILTGPAKGYLDYRGRKTSWGPPLGGLHVPLLARGLIGKAVPAGGKSFFHRVEIQGSELGEENALKGALFQVVEGGAVVTAAWRVAGNTKETILLDPREGPAFSPDLAGKTFQVKALYLDLWSGPEPGLPMTSEGGRVFPVENVRIGFAACRGFDEKGNPLDRYPEKGFTYDLAGRKARERFWKDSSGKYLPRPYLMLDVLFNLSFDPSHPAVSREPLSRILSRPLPEIRKLWIPLRY